MTDLELYHIIKDNATEYNKDGMFFIPPYNAQEFLHGLEIRDAEGGVECHVVGDGYLAFDTHDFEDRFETDIEKVIELLNKDIGYE